MMKYLQHGTSISALDKILEQGILPRGKKRSNWDVKSGSNKVYLTQAYAPYFAAAADSPANERNAVVLQIDCTKLDKDNLVADEDALEQADRRCNISSLGPSYKDAPMQQRTLVFEKRAAKYRSYGLDAEWSLSVLGTCAHIGPIDVEAISAYAIVKQSILMIWDPTITLINFRILGATYTENSSLIFNEDIELDKVNEQLHGVILERKFF